MSDAPVDPLGLSCSEVRVMPINMADADRSEVISHVMTCDACRNYLAERTCD